MRLKNALLQLLFVSTLCTVSCNICPNYEAVCLQHVQAECPNSGPDHFELVDSDSDKHYTFNLTTHLKTCSFDMFKLVLTHLNVTKRLCESRSFDYDNVMLDSANVKMNVDMKPLCSQVRISFNCIPQLNGCYDFLFKQLSNGRSFRPFNYTIWINNYPYLDNDSDVAKFSCLDEKHFKAILDLNNNSLHMNYLNYEVWLTPPETSTLPHLKNLERNCTMNNYRITCLFDIGIGNYTFSIKFPYHPNCVSGIKSCIWTHQIVRKWSNLENRSSSLTDPKTDSFKLYNFALMFIGIFGLCITSLVGWVFYKKKRLQKVSQQTYDNVLCHGVDCHVQHLEKVTGIYLIYARDCLPFMRVMENFRYLLKKMTGCKVYDVFDDALFCEIAMSPNEWVLSHIQDPKIRIVLVATECADRLYKNLLHYYSQKTKPGEQYCRDLYLSPSYCDSILKYSLKLLSFDVNPAPYHKIFVVRFPKFNKNSDYMTHVNPYKRFDMPENLGVLVENIFHQATVEVSDDSDSDDPLEGYRICYEKPTYNEQTFVESVKELNEFFKQNPTYLMEDIMINEADIDPFETNASILTRSRSSML